MNEIFHEKLCPSEKNDGHTILLVLRNEKRSLFKNIGNKANVFKSFERT